MVRFEFLLVLLLVAGSSLAPGSALGLVSHDLAAELIPQRNRLAAVDRLTLPRPEAGFLELRLAPQAAIDEVSSGGRGVPYAFTSGRLRIGPLPGAPGSRVDLEIAYHGSFTDPVPEAPLNTEDPTYGVAAAINREGTFLSGSSGWHPWLPGEDAHYRISVRAPKGVWAVTAGRLVERREAADGTLSVWDIDFPSGPVTLAAGPYLVDEDRAGPVPVYTFFGPGNRSLAPTYLDAAREDLARFVTLFGPYPFAKFAVVENFFPTGYGFPSWTLLGSSVVRLPFIVETSLGHEIAHNWWGTGVRVDYRHGNWSEGLATYVADYLSRERQSPEAARDYRLKLLRDYASLVAPGDGYPLAEFTSRRSKRDQAIGYGKSAMVFHMARRRTGDEKFWQGLQAVAREKMFREADWQDFSRAFAVEGVPGMDAFFRQWVERPGAPLLALEEVETTRNAQGWSVRGELVQELPAYALDVPLRLQTEGGGETTVFRLEKERGVFTLQSRERPLTLAVDPDADVFRRLWPEEIPPTVNSLRGSGTLVVVTASTLAAEARQAGRDLLTGLGVQGRWLEEDDATPADIAGADLLLIGWPETPFLRPGLPEELAVTGRSFTVAGESYAEAGDALFAALPHPATTQQTAALLLPLSGRAGTLAARKIPHYGKFSYLVFSEGRNRAKGTWAPPRSPLIHHFDHPGTTPSSTERPES